jgi:hypothetical protein
MSSGWVKYGGASLMLWSYFTSIGLVALVMVKGIMNMTKYQNLVASVRRLTLGHKWISHPARQ